MSNNLGYYNPAFYANEALIQLEKSLGMAGRIHRGYEAERRAFGKGDTVNMKRPGVFTAQDAPSTAQDLAPESVSVTLNYWKEVKFQLTDKELAYTTEQMIDDHIRPAAVALADWLDQQLCGLYTRIPWYSTTNANPGSAVSDLTGAHQVLFDNRVPMDERMLHFMVDGTMQNNLLANSAYTQWNGAGQDAVEAQRRGNLGMKFGMNFFANQNVATHTTTPVTSTTPLTNGTFAVGVSTINIDGTALSGTLKAGDILQFAGHTQNYAVTADATASGNAITGLTISPPLKAALADGVAITFIQAAVDNKQRMAFHRNAFGLIMVPLPETGNELGAKIFTISDPITRLSLRARLFYDGDASTVKVALDLLCGFTCLDPNLAVRVVI